MTACQAVIVLMGKIKQSRVGRECTGQGACACFILGE